MCTSSGYQKPWDFSKEPKRSWGEIGQTLCPVSWSRAHTRSCSCWLGPCHTCLLWLLISPLSCVPWIWNESSVIGCTTVGANDKKHFSESIFPPRCWKITSDVINRHRSQLVPPLSNLPFWKSFLLLQHVHCSHLGEIISFKLEKKKTRFLSCVVQYFKTLWEKWDIDPDQDGENTHYEQGEQSVGGEQRAAGSLEGCWPYLEWAYTRKRWILQFKVGFV